MVISIENTKESTEKGNRTTSEFIKVAVYMVNM